MELTKELVDSLKATIRMRHGCVLASVTVSLYVLSRSLSIAAGGVEPTSATFQFRRDELAFSYLAMSIIWPLAIGALSLALATLAERQRATMQLLIRRDAEIGRTLGEALDPFRSVTAGVTQFDTIVRRLPVIALFAHALAICWYMASQPLDLRRPWSDEWRVLACWSAYAAGAYGLRWTLAAASMPR